MQIGRVRWRLDGPLPPPEKLGFLRDYLTAGADAELSVRIELQPTPQPEGELCWEDWYSRVYESSDERCVLRIGGPLNAPVPYAVLRWRAASPDEQRLTMDDSNLPYTGDRLATALAMELGLHRHGHGILHAAWIERNGAAVWFSGASGIGKSTQADFWAAERGAPIVNGDKAAFYFEDERVVACGLPFAGTSEYCKNRTMPLRAIIMIARAEENLLVRLPLREAIRRLIAQMPVQRWCREDLQAITDQAVRLAELVPVYQLSCRKDPATVALLDEELSKEEQLWNP